jgi:hypothetical protein
MTGYDLAGSAAAAVARLVHEFGARAGPEGADPVQLLAPAAALRIARQVELAARAEVTERISRARGDGLSWAEVGGLLRFGPLAAGTGASVAEYAAGYAMGPRTAGSWFDPPVFAWTCPVCGQLISDRGPVLMPAADEAGTLTAASAWPRYRLNGWLPGDGR